jgi:hypothetical protein
MLAARDDDDDDEATSTALVMPTVPLMAESDRDEGSGEDLTGEHSPAAAAAPPSGAAPSPHARCPSLTTSAVVVKPWFRWLLMCCATWQCFVASGKFRYA